jgi:hypothetical protein
MVVTENNTPPTVMQRLIVESNTQGEQWFNSKGAAIVVAAGHFDAFPGLGSPIIAHYTASNAFAFSFLRLNLYMNIKTYTSGTGKYNIQYTDENGVAQNFNVINAVAVGLYSLTIFAKVQAGSTLTVRVPTLGGTATGDGEVVLEMLN